MICEVCNHEFYYTNVKDIITLRKLCNNCAELFIYNKKSVRINKIYIKIYYLKNYDYLIGFENHNKLIKFNDYITRKNILNSSNKVNIKQKNIRLYYYHSDLYENLSLILKQLKKGKKHKITIFELIK